MEGYIHLLIIGFGCLIVYNLFLKKRSVKEHYVNPGAIENEPTGASSGYDGNIAMYTDPQSGEKSWASPYVYRIEVVEDAESAQDRRDAANDRGTILNRCAQDKQFVTTNKQGMDAIEERIKWGKQEITRVQPMIDKNIKGIAANKLIITNIAKKTQDTANAAGKGADNLQKMAGPSSGGSGSGAAGSGGSGGPAIAEPTKGGPMSKAIWLFTGGNKSA